MNVNFFLSGVYMATFAASGIFFYKFYKASGDRLFRFFAFACWLLSIERIGLLFVENPFPTALTTATEAQSWVYIFRLVAFLLILYAIIDKNRKSSS